MQHVKKRRLTQKTPLTVDLVKWLEKTVRQDPSTHDRACAGFTLFMVYGRLRFSDAQLYIRKEPDVQEDGSGYLECEQKPGKTAVTLQQKTQMIKVTRPLNGLDLKHSWIQAWLNIFERGRV